MQPRMSAFELPECKRFDQRPPTTTHRSVVFQDIAECVSV